MWFYGQVVGLRFCVGLSRILGLVKCSVNHNCGQKLSRLSVITPDCFLGILCDVYDPLYRLDPSAQESIKHRHWDPLSNLSINLTHEGRRLKKRRELVHKHEMNITKNKKSYHRLLPTNTKQCIFTSLFQNITHLLLIPG